MINHTLKLTSWKKIALLFFICILAVLAGCEKSSSSKREAKDPAQMPQIVMGARSATEQHLLMKISTLLLRDHGYRVKEMNFSDSSSLRNGLEAGVADISWEYTNTVRMYIHKKPPIFDSDRAFKEVKEEDGKKGLIWLSRSEFDSSWVILMREDLAKNLNIQTISDLARYTNQENVEIELQSMKFAFNEEFLRREDGVKRLNEVYGFSIKDENVLAVENNLLAQAVKESRVQVAVGWVADSRIKKYHLTALEDDRDVFPPYHVAPIIRQETMDSHPEIAELLDKISKKLNNEVMIDLTYKVEVLHQDVFAVARQFLKENDLLKK